MELELAFAELATAAVCVGFVAIVISICLQLASGASVSGNQTVVKTAAGAAFGTAIGFGFLAYSAGFLAGFSRVAILGQLLPAALGLFGGVAVFLFGKDVQNRALVGVAIASFSACLLMGFLMGYQDRRDAERFEAALKYDVQFRLEQARKELAINTVRNSYGLAPLVFDETTPKSTKDDEKETD